jgi:hypothetical protein
MVDKLKVIQTKPVEASFSASPHAYSSSENSKIVERRPVIGIWRNNLLFENPKFIPHCLESFRYVPSNLKTFYFNQFSIRISKDRMKAQNVNNSAPNRKSNFPIHPQKANSFGQVYGIGLDLLFTFFKNSKNLFSQSL